MRVTHSQSEFLDDVPEYYEPQEKVQIIHEEGREVTQQLEQIFEDEHVQIIEMDAGERGGSGSPLIDYIILGMVIHVFLNLGTGFFDELGREIARKISKALASKNKPSHITVSVNHKGRNTAVSVTFPADCSEEDILKALESIDQHLRRDNPGSLRVVFDKTGGKLTGWYRE